MKACRVGTTLIWNPDSTMKACRVGTMPIWKPRFYYGNQNPIIETNILLWKHVEWEQCQFGNPDSTMETNILL
jgi:hypothetical protein